MFSKKLKTSYCLLVAVDSNKSNIASANFLSLDEEEKKIGLSNIVIDVQPGAIIWINISIWATPHIPLP